MTDLRDQIRTYYEATTEPVDIDAITVDPGTVLVGPFPDAAQRRSAMQTITPEKPPTSRVWKGLAAAAAVALIVIIAAGAALLLASGSGDEIEPASPDSTITVNEALATADAYFAAHEAGEFENMAGLFAPDAKGTVVGATATLEIPRLLGFVERLRAWNVAQGTTHTPIECDGAETPDGIVRVTCTFEESRALHQAVGAPPIPNTVTMLVATDGITNWIREIGQPDYNTVALPFGGWMRSNHSEDAAATLFAGWTSLEEAEQFGRLLADYAEEWAAYLAVEGCTYAYEIC